MKEIDLKKHVESLGSDTLQMFIQRQVVSGFTKKVHGSQFLIKIEMREKTRKYTCRRFGDVLMP
jgi:hypothetical protein